MSFPQLQWGRVVTLVRTEVTGRDDYGNGVRTVVAHDIGGCTWWPRESTEIQNESETVLTGLTLLVPPGVVVEPTDRVIVETEEWEVQGRPMDWSYSPFTASRAGVQVELRRVTG